ncbi:AAA family ATPase [Dongia sp.]|uniref:AAA family ATPase n=1 Tax=Dongia sp. TaxID=1977262 RepID=UPI0035AECD37
MSEVSNEEILARSRRAKAFKRRSAAAETGLHLPSLHELLQMQGFCGGDMQHDAKVFAQRLMTRLKPHWATFEPTKEALLALSLTTDAETCLTAAQALRFTADEDEKHEVMWEESARRCELYAAVSGSDETAWRIAGYCFDLADDPRTPGEQVLAFSTVGVGWVLVAAGKAKGFPRYWKPRHVIAHELGFRMVDRIVTEVDTAAKIQKQISADTAGEDRKAVSRLTALKKRGADSASGEEADDADVENIPTAVVMREIGSPASTEGRAIVKQFQAILNTPLPLLPMPDLAVVRKTLLTEFSYAAPVIENVINDLRGRDHVKFRPTIFVGTPGSGKTAFARRLFELLGVPYELYGCGGVADATLAGTARRWSSGEACLPLSLMLRHMLASPGILLDETEKVATSKQNGSLLDALLSMTEPQSSERWHDPYVQAAVDLRHVLWIGTANSMNGIPAPLRDRCRRIIFPTPTAEHLVPLASRIMATLHEEQGLDPRWVGSFDQVELDAMRSSWPGGSLRKLQLIVGVILKSRDKFSSTN